MIDRLGNLTLLGRRLNISIKNADFATKKEKAYADSGILMTKELLDPDTWNAEAVDERQRELSTWAFGIWHFPGEEPPPQPEDVGEAAPSDEGKDRAEAETTPEHLPEVPTL